MKIEVTQANIDLGEKGNPHHCPLACALEYVLEEVDYLVIPSKDGGYVEVSDPETNEYLYDITLPAAANNFAVAFDDGLHVEPFEFELTIPRGQ